MRYGEEVNLRFGDGLRRFATEVCTKVEVIHSSWFMTTNDTEPVPKAYFELYFKPINIHNSS